MATYSDVLVACMALNLCGIDQDIEALDPDSEDDTVKLLTRWFPISRDLVLSSFDWPFAIIQVDLGLEETDPNDEWSYAFNYPAACLKALRIVSGVRPEPVAVPFVLAWDGSSRLIWTDQPNAILEMVTTYEEAGEWNDRFALAVAADLAGKIAGPLKVAVDRVESAKATGREQLVLAQAAALKEGRATPAPLSRYVTARGCGPRDRRPWTST